MNCHFKSARMACGSWGPTEAEGERSQELVLHWPSTHISSPPPLWGGNVTRTQRNSADRKNAELTTPFINTSLDYCTGCLGTSRFSQKAPRVLLRPGSLPHSPETRPASLPTLSCHHRLQSWGVSCPPPSPGTGGGTLAHPHFFAVFQTSA